MQYYQRLKDVREDKDLKQGDVAEILKTTQQQYSRWESGAFQMPMENYKILARYYNVSLDYLAGLIDFPRELHERLKKTGVTFYKN
jgi:transcriptional regulator with XRE-family HTH domain